MKDLERYQDSILHQKSTSKKATLSSPPFSPTPRCTHHTTHAQAVETRNCILGTFELYFQSKLYSLGLTFRRLRRTRRDT
mmetsp:Transcript_9054/g.13240  ORF Transcript_9054/g.13240 Transcript_9054/m.13240 type:complete len:80 (-) Transcript_9054:105-344(-)